MNRKAVTKMRFKPIFIGTILLTLLGFSTGAGARVDVRVGVTPPRLAISSPPEVVVIPNTYVYYAPDVQTDIFFYHGYWYRPYQGYWFRSAGYSGPWVRVEDVPYVLLNLPPDYRAMHGYRRIPHRELSRNWRTWERDRYWERNNWGRRDQERERHHGVAPQFRDRERERHDFDRHRERH